MGIGAAAGGGGAGAATGSGAVGGGGAAAGLALAGAAKRKGRTMVRAPASTGRDVSPTNLTKVNPQAECLLCAQH